MFLPIYSFSYSPLERSCGHTLGGNCLLTGEYQQSMPDRNNTHLLTCQAYYYSNGKRGTALYCTCRAAAQPGRCGFCHRVSRSETISAAFPAFPVSSARMIRVLRHVVTSPRATCTTAVVDYIYYSVCQMHACVV